MKTIKNKEQIAECNLFLVDNFQWNSLTTPKVKGRLGYIDDIGYYLKMTCLEKNPLTTYKNHLDPVYNDSAMEAFFCFTEVNKERPDKESFYTNIEFNSSGAIYAGYGYGRNNRKTYDNEQINSLGLTITKKPDFWQAEFILGKKLIASIYKEKKYSVWGNFYKISENPSIEHYGSYKKIDSPTPNFHRPDCFAALKII